MAALLQRSSLSRLSSFDSHRTQAEKSSMESAVVKHSIVIAGHRTSVSLEKEFWNALKEIAHAKHMTLSDLVALIDSDRQHGNLSSAIRLFVLGFYRHQNWLGASKRQSGRAPATDRSASV
jgi:predicted DNA-binding ribbon-helix-helix protein